MSEGAVWNVADDKSARRVAALDLTLRLMELGAWTKPWNLGAVIDTAKRLERYLKDGE